MFKAAPPVVVIFPLLIAPLARVSEPPAALSASIPPPKSSTLVRLIVPPLPSKIPSVAASNPIKGEDPSVERREQTAVAEVPVEGDRAAGVSALIVPALMIRS